MAVDTVTRPPRAVVLQRVRQQVPRYLLQAMLVTDYWQHLAHTLDVNRDLFRSRCRPEYRNGGVDDRAEIHRGHGQTDTALDHPRDVEEVFDQPGLDLRVAIDRINGPLPLLVIGERAGLEHVDPADDRVERRAQLVRRGCQKLILQLTGFLGDLARCFRTVDCRRPLIEREMQLMEIHRGADPADDIAVVVAIGDDAGAIPAVLTAGGAETKLSLEEILRPKRILPAHHQAISIVGMNRIGPAKPKGPLARQSGHRKKPRADENRLAVGAITEQMDRTEVRDQPELLLAQLELSHRIRERTSPLGDLLLDRGERFLQPRFRDSASAQLQ